MNQWMKVACATAVACVACTKSDVEPDADIVLTGKVLQEDKKPLANTLLKISRSSNSECIFTFFFDDIDWKSVKTDAEGAFRQELLGADTQNGSLARCFHLSVSGPNGSSMYAEFTIQTEQVQLPLLQQWSGTPAATEAASGVSVSYKDISATQEGVSASYSIEVTGTGGSIWRQGVQGSPALLNDDLLEDASGLKASVSAFRSAGSGKSTFEIHQKGVETAVSRRARIPASRGAACTYTNAPTPCPLTDGELGRLVNFPDNTRELVFTLSQPKVLRKAVLRNFAARSTVTELVLEGSADGTQWVPLANLLEGSSTPVRSFIEVALSHPTSLSQVRLRASAANDTYLLERLSELSLFE